jgi:hypothetical protein
MGKKSFKRNGAMASKDTHAIVYNENTGARTKQSKLRLRIAFVDGFFETVN